jgi:hypothetical protein
LPSPARGEGKDETGEFAEYRAGAILGDIRGRGNFSGNFLSLDGRG